MATFVGCLSQQALATFVLHVGNNTPAEFVEFRIRATDSGRPWTKMRLEPREKKTVSLVSNDPFDVEIWRWTGDGQWTVARQTGIYFQNSFDGGHYFTMEHSTVRQSAGRPSQERVLGELESASFYKSRDEGMVVWPVARGPFRLVPRYARH